MALKRLYQRPADMFTDVHMPKSENPDPIVYLTPVAETTLRRACQRQIEAKLDELRRQFPAPTCGGCVDRALATATVCVLVKQAPAFLASVDDLEQFVTILVNGLVREFNARQVATAQAATTTKPPQVH